MCKFDTDLYAFRHLFGLLLHECTSSKYTKFSTNKVHYHNRLCQKKKFSLTCFCQGLKLLRNQSIDCQCRFGFYLTETLSQTDLSLIAVFLLVFSAILFHYVTSIQYINVIYICSIFNLSSIFLRLKFSFAIEVAKKGCEGCKKLLLLARMGISHLLKQA